MIKRFSFFFSLTMFYSRIEASIYNSDKNRQNMEQNWVKVTIQ